MAYTIKHENILLPNPGRGRDDFNYFEFSCRGAQHGRKGQTLRNFISSTEEAFNRQNDNSYLMFVEEPENAYDSDAISILCRGEMFGTVGYVGYEFTRDIKAILSRCDSYRIDLVDRHAPIDKNVRMVVTWQE